MKQRSIIANGVIISAYKLAINLMLKLMHVTRLSHPLSDLCYLIPMLNSIIMALYKLFLEFPEILIQLFRVFLVFRILSMQSID